MTTIKLSREFAVQVEIRARGTIPGKIGRHRVPHQSSPFLLDGIEAQGSIDGRQQRSSFVGYKQEPSPASCGGIELFDRILEAARRSYNRDRAVFQAVKLVQSGRFISGGHHKEIGSRFDLVRQGLVESDSNRDLAGVALRQRAEMIFVPPLSRSEKDKLQVPSEQRVQHVSQDVQTLLVRQSRDDGQNRDIRCLGEPQMPLKIGLANLLAGNFLKIVVVGDEPVGRRIPHVIVRTVEYSDQTLRALLEDALQPETVLTGFDLFGIGAAHRRYGVRKDHARLEEVYLSIRLHMTRREEPAVQVQKMPVLSPEETLITQVVNRQDRARARQGRIALRLGSEESHSESRLPVVTVKNVRRIHAMQGLERSPGEKNEALRVVRIIT